MKLFGIFDVTGGRIVSVFLAKDDITALRMNVSTPDVNDSPLRRGFNLVRILSIEDGEIDNYDTICRLVDCTIELSSRLEKEGL